MRKVKKYIGIMLLIIFIIIPLSEISVYAAPNNSAKGKLAYNLEGLHHNLNVQNFYVGSTYLYVTQKTGTKTYLSRCKINGDTATYQDEMTLTNCGHGQTLEYMEYEGKPYFLVGSKDKEVDGYVWSVQIGVIQYNASKTLDYTDMKRFSYMNYANKTATTVGETKRVAAATSQNNNRIIFRIQTMDNKVMYSIYDRNLLLKKLLTETNDKKLDMRIATKCCLSSFIQTGSNKVLPNGSFQGIEMTETNKIYVSGGGEGQTPQIAKMNLSGVLQSTVSIIGVPLTESSLTPEIEGLQAKTVNGEDRLYFVLPYYTYNNLKVIQKKNTQKIYYITEGDF